MLDNVIVADDSSTARMIIKRCLEIAGFMEVNLIDASNGEEALKIARESDIDMIITDLNMPKMNGHTLLKYVKSSPRLNEVPVIIVSSASNPTIDEELKKNGALAVIHKPITPSCIANALQTFKRDQKSETDEWGET